MSWVDALVFLPALLILPLALYLQRGRNRRNAEIFQIAAERLGLAAPRAPLGGRYEGQVGAVRVVLDVGARAIALQGTSPIPSQYPASALASRLLKSLMDTEAFHAFHPLPAVQDGNLVISIGPTVGPVQLVDLVHQGTILLERFLTLLDHPDPAQLLEIARRDPYESVRAEAVRDLLTRGGGEAVAARSSALSDRSFKVRLALGLGPPVDAETLEALVRDERVPAEIRERAAHALSAQRKAEGLEPGSLALAESGSEGALSLQSEGGELSLPKK